MGWILRSSFCASIPLSSQWLGSFTCTLKCHRKKGYQRNIYDISYVTNHARVSFIFSSLHSLRLFSLPCHYSPNLSVLLYPSIDNTQPFCRPTTIRAWSSLYFSPILVGWAFTVLNLEPKYAPFACRMRILTPPPGQNHHPTGKRDGNVWFLRLWVKSGNGIFLKSRGHEPRPHPI